METMSCPSCGTENHPDSWDDFITCHRCKARLVRRGRGWEELTGAELQRLELIDLRWHAERDRYKVWDRPGSTVPSVLGSVLQLVVFIGGAIGLFWWARTKAPGPDRERDIMIALIIGVAGGLYSLYRLIVAREYTKAYDDYRRRRLESVLQRAAPEQTTTDITAASPR